MLSTTISPFVLAAIHAPVLWVIGLVLLIGGIILLFRSAVIGGVALIIIGVILGALNLL